MSDLEPGTLVKIQQGHFPISDKEHGPLWVVGELQSLTNMTIKSLTTGKLLFVDRHHLLLPEEQPDE